MELLIFDLKEIGEEITLWFWLPSLGQNHILLLLRKHIISQKVKKRV